MSEKIYVALGPNVFVKEIKREVKIGGMIVPDSLDNDFTFGEVVSCSQGYFDKGTFIAANIQVGDKVAFPRISGSKVNFNNEKLIRVHMNDLVAKEVEGHIEDEESDSKEN